LQAADSKHFKDKDAGTDLEVVEKVSLLEWLANNYKKFGCNLEFITNRCVWVWVCGCVPLPPVTCLVGVGGSGAGARRHQSQAFALQRMERGFGYNCLPLGACLCPCTPCSM